MTFAMDGRSDSDNHAHGHALRNVFTSVRERLSVLVVTPFLPSPPLFGAQRRLHELISGVAASNEASVLSLVDPGDNHDEGIRATEEYCRRVVTVSNPAYHTSRAWKRMQQLVSLG